MMYEPILERLTPLGKRAVRLNVIRFDALDPDKPFRMSPSTRRWNITLRRDRQNSNASASDQGFSVSGKGTDGPAILCVMPLEALIIRRISVGCRRIIVYGYPQPSV